MRKIVIIVGIFLFLVLTAGYFWWWKFRPQKPGRCLVMDDRYCNLLKQQGDNDFNYRISATVPKNVKVFAPVSGNCRDKFLVIREGGNKRLSGVKVENNNGDTTYEYTLLFGGKRCDGEIKKGEVIGETVDKGNLEILILSWNNNLSEEEKRYKSILERGLMYDLIKK